MTLAYIRLRAREITRNTETRAITRVKIGKKPKTVTKQQKRVIVGTGSRKEQCSQEPISQVLQFPLFSAILSSWFLIYNVEFDSNSSCLDRLKNFGIISSQKIQNLLQNAIIRIVGTLMCKSG